VHDSDIIIGRIKFIRTTIWDQAPTLDIGTTADTSWFTNTLPNLAGAQPSATVYGVEVIEINRFLAAGTPLRTIWDQNSATTGAGSMVIDFLMLR
jgi:hypothetical protein